MTREQKNELAAILSQISNLAGRAASILGSAAPPDELNLEGGSPPAEKIRFMPKGWKSMTTNQKKVERVLNNSPMMIRVGSWFGRKPTTLWTVQEAEMLLKIAPEEKEVHGMEILYTADIPKNEFPYRRDQLPTLLANWSGELDKARKYVNSLRNS